MKKKLTSLKACVTSYNLRKHKFLLIVAVEIAAILAALLCFTGAYAAKDLWQLKVGDQTIATVASQEDAEETIKLLEQHYTDDKAYDVKIEIDPVIEVQKTFYGSRDKTPDVSKAEDAMQQIVSASEVKKNALLQVTATQTVDKKESIDFKTEYKDSGDVAQNTEFVKSEGKKGKRKVSVETTTVNGEVVNSKTVDSEVVKKPEKKVVLKGTAYGAGLKGETSTNNGAEYSLAAGQAVADFALQFVGNPYKYGGSSLTNGADCSGFVMAVYDHFGVGLPHDAGADRAYGVGVTLDEAQPGDLICYYGHIGIYIGNNQIVHAMDEKNGITVKTIGYNGKPILTVRRIFG